MTLPRRFGRPSQLRAFFSLGCLTLAWSSLAAQVPIIPLVNQLAEVEQRLNAKKPGDAAGLLDEIIKRVQGGDALPEGVTLDRLLLTGANVNFQIQQYARAAELAGQLEKLPSLTSSARNEARMIQGLSLALQQKYAEAVPVFRAAEESQTFRDKAMLYGAMSANQANLIPVAIETYNRLLATAPRDRDWADAALSLVDLHLRAGNLEDARRGLQLLRGKLDLVDNITGLNVLSLQLGDALLKARDYAGALTAFRNVSGRDNLIAEQKKRIAGLERALARFRGIVRPSATDADTIRRLNARLEQAKSSLAQVEKLPDFDATLRYRLGVCFQERGGAWEAALLYEDLIANFPNSTERENAYFGLIRAYADTGRFEKVKDAVERFTKAFPNSKFGPQALYMASMAASQRSDLSSKLAFLDLAATKYGNFNELSEQISLMRANTYFTLGRYEEAKNTVLAYARDFPQGKFVEDALYLAAMSDLAEGRASLAEKQVRDYLQAYPEGRFVADARYRLAAAAYAKQDFKGCIEIVDKWLADFPPEQPQRGELYSLRGDALAGLDQIEEAIDAYRQALKFPIPDELLGYVLDELTRHYQSRRDFDAAVKMWTDFAAERPDHPYVINAAYWISRIRSREGKTDEAITLVSEIVRRYIADPARGDVERLLVEIAASMSRTPRARRGEPKPTPVPETVLFKRVEQLLLAGANGRSPTAQARALFTQAEVASNRKRNDLAEQLLGKIASNYTPEQLPPGILGKVGDSLLDQGQPQLARRFYEQILGVHPKSIFADFGYVGLGRIALQEGKGDEALARFNDAIDIAGARFKLKEATLGRARAQLLLGRTEEARLLLEEVAANRAWRGEATAESLFLLGEIYFQRGTPEDLAKAQAHYQRIYLSYKRFPLWVSKSYLRSAETFEKLGQFQEALTTVNRFFTFRELEKFPEWRQAVSMKPRLEARVPASSAATPPEPQAATVALPARS